MSEAEDPRAERRDRAARLAAAEAEVRTLSTELERLHRRHDVVLRERGSLEDRIESQAAELDRRRTQVEALEVALEAARWAAGAPGHWSDPAVEVQGFWQSPVALAELNRRITGAPDRHPDVHFRDRHRREGPVPVAVGVGGARTATMRRALELPLAERLVWLDPASEPAAAARDRLEPELAERVELVAADPGGWAPAEGVQLVVAQGALDGADDLGAWAGATARLLAPGGLLYLDDYVGPPAAAWAPRQVELAQRLLDRLSPALRRDLIAGDGAVSATAPAPGAEEGRLDELLEALERHLVPVEIVPYGGGLVLPLFSRIMGNFAGNDDLVRVLMEVDAIATETALVESAYLWGVWRAP